MGHLKRDKETTAGIVTSKSYNVTILIPPSFNTKLRQTYPRRHDKQYRKLRNRRFYLSKEPIIWSNLIQSGWYEISTIGKNTVENRRNHH